MPHCVKTGPTQSIPCGHFRRPNRVATLKSLEALRRAAGVSVFEDLRELLA